MKIAMHDALCKEVDDFFEHERDSVHARARYESDDEKDAENSLSIGRMRRGRMKEDEVLKVDDFSKLNQIRYMSDWGGALRDVEGQDSMAAASAPLSSAGALNDLYQDDSGLLDDANDIEEQREIAYFEELRRRLQAQAELDDSMETNMDSYLDGNMDMEDGGYDSVLEDDDADEVSELPLVTAEAMESTGHNDSSRGNYGEDEGDDEDEDEDDSEFMEVSATPSQALPDQSTPMSASHETLEGEDVNGDSGEEDMEEIL